MDSHFLGSNKLLLAQENKGNLNPLSKIIALLAKWSLAPVDDKRLDIQERSTIHYLEKGLLEHLEIFLQSSSMKKVTIYMRCEKARWASVHYPFSKSDINERAD
jgi:hypothetical protein